MTSLQRFEALPPQVQKVDISEFQRENAIWADKNFPNAQPWEPLLGINEEAGEMSHAFLKRHQKIRGTPEEHHAALEDAAGDIFVYLMHFCTLNNISLEQAIFTVWSKVRRRDWEAARAVGSKEPVEIVRETDTYISVCPVCKHTIPTDQHVRVNGVSVHIACAGTHART